MGYYHLCSSLFKEEEREREVSQAKKVTHAVTFFLPLPKEPLWMARERERERSWKWVSSSCDCFGFDLGSIYRVYTRICPNPPPLFSSETRQLCCTDTNNRERESLYRNACSSDGFEYVAKRGTTNPKNKNSLQIL